jgi:hypothetical protein
MAERTEDARINAYINHAQAMGALGEMQREFAKTKKSQKDLETGSKEWIESQKKLDEIAKKYTEYAKTVDKSAMSMRQLQQHSAKLKDMQKDFAPASEEFKKLQKEIDATNGVMKKSASSMESLPGPIGRAKNAVSELGQQFMKLLRNPVVLFVVAIASALYGLFRAFTSTDSGGTKFAATMEQIKAVIDVVRQRAALLAESLMKFVSGDFKGAAEDFKNSFAGIAEQIKNATDAARDYIYALDELQDAEIGYISQRSKNLNKIAKLEFEANSKANSIEERRKYLEQAIKISEEEARKEEYFAKQRYELELEKVAKINDINKDLLKDFIEADDVRQKLLLQQAGKNGEDLRRVRNNLNDEGQKQLEEFYSKSIEADTKFFEENKKNNAKIAAFQEKIDEDRRKSQEEANKHLQELNKQLLEARIRLMADGQEKEIAIEKERLRVSLKNVKEGSELEALLKEESRRKIEEINIKYDEEEKRRKKEADDKLKLDKKRVEDEFKSDLQKEIDLINEHYQLLLSLKVATAEEEQLLEQKKIDAIAEINRKYREHQAQEENRLFAERMQKFEEFYALTEGIVRNGMAIQTNLENQELQDFKNKQNSKKQQLETRLNSGAISEEQYRIEIEKLDKQFDRKRRSLAREQFEREKKAAVITATIDGILATMKALRSTTPPASFVIAGLTAAMAATQVGAIASQPVPEFADGGLLTGGVSHSHPSGGMPVIDPVSGKVRAKLEQDEFIINKESTAANLPLIELINNSRGRTITPDQVAAVQPSVNVSRAAKMLIMEKGGLLDRTAASSMASQSTPDAIADNSNSSKIVSLLTEIRDKKGIIYLQELKKELNNMDDLELSNKIK